MKRNREVQNKEVSQYYSCRKNKKLKASLIKSIGVIVFMMMFIVCSLSTIVSTSSVLYAQEQQLPINREPINISNSSGDANSPRIATFGDNVYVVWADYTTGRHDIYFARSTSRGSSFTEPINISQNLGNSVTPAIAVYENNVYVVWSDDDDDILGNNNYEVLLRWSPDGGNTFSEPINVSNNNGESDAPTIAVSENNNDNNLYIAWLDNSTTTTNNINRGIYFTSSGTNDIAAGALGSQPVEVVKNVGSLSHPEIAAFESNVYLVWPNNPSVTSSNTTSSAFNATAPTLSSSSSPSPAPQLQDIFFIASQNEGSIFNNPINLSNNSGIIESSDVPDIDVSATNGVYVVWHEIGMEANNRVQQEIFITRSEDGGNTFGRSINISNNAGISDLPVVAVFENRSSSGLVYVAWKDDLLSNRNSSSDGASSNVFLVNSRSEAQPMDFGFGNADRPDMDFSFNDDVYVVWEDFNLLSGSDIFFTKFDAVAFSAIADQTTTAVINNNNNEDATQQAGLLSYENSVLGFQMRYPSHFEITEFEPGGVSFHTPLENIAENDIFPEQVGILSVGDLPLDISINDNAAINEYLNSLVNNFRAEFPGFNVIQGPSETTIDGNIAQQMILKQRLGNSEFNFMEIWTTKYGRVYQIEVSVETGMYPSFPPAHIQQMLDSLKIT